MILSMFHFQFCFLINSIVIIAYNVQYTVYILESKNSYYIGHDDSIIIFPFSLIE